MQIVILLTYLLTYLLTTYILTHAPARQFENGSVLMGRSNQTDVGQSSIVILKCPPRCTYNNFRQFLIYSTFALVVLQNFRL